jgi:hypothetical protein
MTNANVSGWDFILPQDVTVIWDGVNDSSPDHIKVIEGQYYNGSELVRTNTANGMLTFNLGVIIETDKNHYSILKGSPNYFFDDAVPVEVIIRTDHYNFLENFICWKMTTANKPITFKKGMPIALLVNYPIGLLESTHIGFKNIDSDKEKNEQIQEYTKLKENLGTDLNEWEWTHSYRKLMSLGKNEVKVNLKPKLMEP